MLTHRERVRSAFNHQEPDRVPIDLGGTLSTTINLGAYDRLKQRLGVTSETRVGNKPTPAMVCFLREDPYDCRRENDPCHL